jgi:copper transport protein
MTMIRAAAVVLLGAAVVLGATTMPARGHALLDRAEPATGSVVPDDAAPRRLALDFTEAVGLGPGAIVVLDGNQRRVGPLEPRLVTPSRVEIDVPSLAAGAYAVRWRVTSADSHVVRGTSWFVVGFASSPPPAFQASGPPVVPWLEVMARWLGLVAGLGLVGTVLFEWILRAGAASPGFATSVHPVMPTLLGILLVTAEILRVGAQAVSVAEVPLPAALDRSTLVEVFFRSRFAAWWWLRVIAGAALAARLARRPRARQASMDTLLLAALLLVATATAGHAMSGRLPLAITVIADCVHLAAAALWLGGLAYVGFVLAARRHASEVRVESLAATGGGGGTLLGFPLNTIVPRLSAAALVSVLVLLVTGAVNAYAQVGSLAWLIRSAYGEALLLKLGLVAAWLAIAAVNRFALLPRLAAKRLMLTSLVRAEAIVGVAVLLIVGLLGSLPPPGARSLPVATEVARQAGPLRVSLLVDPTWVGVSRFRVVLTDDVGASPSGVARVVLTFTMDGMNMGRTHVTLAPRDGGVWETEGFYLGMPGLSQIGVAIARPRDADLNAVFRIEIPDVNAAQLGGLRPVAGVSAFAIFGVVMGVCVVLAVVAAEPRVRRRLMPVAVGVLVLIGLGSTVADRRLRSHVTVEGDARALHGASAIARGRDVYARQCAVCHGPTGNGDGTAAASLLPPPSDLTVHARWHGDDQLFWFVTHGVAGTSMIGFGDRLSARERRDAIAYVQALAVAPTATARRPPPRATSPAQPTVPSSASPEASPAPSPSVSSSPAPSEPPAASAQAVTPPPVPSGPVGRLVYGPDFDNNLWLMALPDGRTTALTHFGPLQFSSNPVWSPDGSRVAFSFYRLPGGDAIPVPDGTDLYVMTATGAGLRLLAGHDARGATLQYPAWSADGKAVYMSATAAGGSAPAIDRIDVASGARVRVVAGAEFPTLSRDGRRLAYVRVAPPPGRGQSLWWSEPGGAGAYEVVAANTFDKLFAPRFAPDGKRLLFAAVGQPASGPRSRRLNPLRLLARTAGITAAFANGDVWDLWTVDLDGRGLTSVTSLGEDLPVAAWSPDGRYVAFLGGGSVRTAEAGITVLEASGAPWRRLTTQPGHRGLDWTRP